MFAPGWDITFAEQDGTRFYATFGLGSPFPEDVKLCAADSAFWPAASPDAARTFNRGPTAIPMLDPELGYHPDNPRRTGPPSFGWDGEQGPFIAGNEVNFASLVRSDYVSHAFSDRTFSGARLVGVNSDELIRRMDALRLCIQSLPEDSKEVDHTKLWLIHAETLEDAPPEAAGIAGPCYRYEFVVPRGKPVRRQPPRAGCCNLRKSLRLLRLRRGRELGDVRGGTVRVLGQPWRDVIDVAVVGGGPAGSAAAIACARAGLGAVLLERRGTPDEARDAAADTEAEESVGPECAALLRALGAACAAPGAPFAGIATGHRMAVFGGGAARAGFHLRRGTLDRALRQAAAAAGAELRLGVEVLGLESASPFRLRTTAGPVAARYLVDATGRRLWLARRLALGRRRLSPPLIAWRDIVTTAQARTGAFARFTPHPDGWTWLAEVSASRIVRIRLLPARGAHEAGGRPRSTMGDPPCRDVAFRPPAGRAGLVDRRGRGGGVRPGLGVRHRLRPPLRSGRGPRRGGFGGHPGLVPAHRRPLPRRIVPRRREPSGGARPSLSPPRHPHPRIARDSRPAANQQSGPDVFEFRDRVTIKQRDRAQPRTWARSQQPCPILT